MSAVNRNLLALILFMLSLNVFALDTKIDAVRMVVDPKLLEPTDSGKEAVSPFSCNSGLEYVPLPAFSAPNYSFIKIEKDGKPNRITQDWPSAAREINKLLPNIATQVAVAKIDGSVSAGGFFGASTHQEQITIDFMKYRSEPVSDSEGKTAIYSRVGAGMRLQIQIVTSEANLGGSLMAVAASARAGKTTGTISTDIIGIDANDVTVSMPFTSDLSEGSIQKIIEALAVVKSKLNDPNTNLVPQFIAKIKCAQAQAVVAKK